MLIHLAGNSELGFISRYIIAIYKFVFAGMVYADPGTPAKCFAEQYFCQAVALAD
jgi:hypothetical protein